MQACDLDLENQKFLPKLGMFLERKLAGGGDRQYLALKKDCEGHSAATCSSEPRTIQ